MNFREKAVVLYCAAHVEPIEAALREAFEAGRRDGLEEAAKATEGFLGIQGTIHDLDGTAKASEPMVRRIVRSIRALAEKKEPSDG